MLDKIYEGFKSDENCIVRCRDIYTDQYGYLNEYAFHQFVSQLTSQPSGEDYFLICFNIDLRLANLVSHAQGDYVLRQFIISLEDYFVFRIQGEKFNMLVTKDQIPKVKELLDKPSEKYKIYYGIVKEKPFFPHSAIEEKEMINKGIALMYAHKGEKRTSINDGIIGDKGNTPKELQETKLRKHISTMWYSKATLIITNPIYKEVTIYIYPTEWKEPLVSMPIIVAIYDNVDYNIKFGTDVCFGVSGFRFSASCRIDRDNHMGTSIYTRDPPNTCKFSVKIESKQGVCVPANFGKRLTATKELYPLRKNASGLYDYILLDDGVISLNTDGCYISPNGDRYGIFMDEEFIELRGI